MSQQDINRHRAERSLLSKHGGRAELSNVELTSERLHLRPITIGDAEDVFEHFTPEVTRYMPTEPTGDIKDTVAFIREAGEQLLTATDLVLVISDKETNEFLGLCGLHTRGSQQIPEFGLWLKSGTHGQGLGTEAISTFRDWASVALDVEAFVYPVHEENIGSRRIAEKLAGKLIPNGRTDEMPDTTVVYILPVSK